MWRPEDTAGMLNDQGLAVAEGAKHGPHRIHVALQTAELTAAWQLQLHKDRRTRTEEERLAGRSLRHCSIGQCGADGR